MLVSKAVDYRQIKALDASHCMQNITLAGDEVPRRSQSDHFIQVAIHRSLVIITACPSTQQKNSSEPPFEPHFLFLPSSRAGGVGRSSPVGITALGRHVSGGSLAIGTQGWPLASVEYYLHGSGEGYAGEKLTFQFPYLTRR